MSHSACDGDTFASSHIATGLRFTHYTGFQYNLYLAYSLMSLRRFIHSARPCDAQTAILFWLPIQLYLAHSPAARDDLLCSRCIIVFTMAILLNFIALAIAIRSRPHLRHTLARAQPHCSTTFISRRLAIPYLAYSPIGLR